MPAPHTYRLTRISIRRYTAIHDFDTIRTDTWIISIPTNWIDQGQTKDGGLHFESEDGEKAMYIITWNLGDDTATTHEMAAESFKQVDLKSLEQMEGYSWKTVEDKTTHTDTFTIAVLDSYAESNAYRIVGKFLARPSIVVRASFHDYACENYSVSRKYFSPIIESLRFYEPTV